MMWPISVWWWMMMLMWPKVETYGGLDVSGEKPITVKVNVHRPYV